MNKIFTIILFIVSSALVVQGQITISSSTLPTSGDTLRTHIDPAPTFSFDSTPQEDGDWTFNDLNSATVLETIFSDPTVGSSTGFPSATSVTVTPEGTEFYYFTDDMGLHELGLYGLDPIAGTLEVDAEYSSPLTVRHAPLNYGDENSQATGLYYPIPLSLIPDTLLNELPIQPDSLRLNVSLQRDDVVDGWGTATVNDVVYDVLRERREEIRQIKVEALLPFLGWQDVSGVIEELAPGFGVGEPDTIVSYNFFTDTEIEPIAVVNVDGEDNPISIEYKANGLTSSDPTPNARKLEVTASPNPSIGILEFMFKGAPADRYRIQVRNIVGQSLWEDSLYIDGKARLSADLTHLNRGTYFYTIFDSNGNPLVTQRLVFIRA